MATIQMLGPQRLRPRVHKVVPAIRSDRRMPGIGIATAGTSLGSFDALASLSGGEWNLPRDPESCGCLGEGMRP
jgi:hypothetical protein